MAQREVRYCTTEDEGRIAYCVESDGAPPGPATILALPAFNESFALDHLMPVYQQFFRDLGRGRRLVRFDWRGHGLSTEGSTRPEKFYADGALDMAAVARAVGAPVTLWAPTITGPPALWFCSEHPELIDRIIFYGTYATVRDAMQATMLEALEQLVAASYETAMRTIADLNGRRGCMRCGGKNEHAAA